jgi:hypothetical protein
VTTARPIFRRQRTQVADAIEYRAGWDIAQRGTRGCNAFREKTWQAHIRSQNPHAAGLAARSLTTHAVGASVYGTACDADGRWGARLLALNRRGVRNCRRRCNDDPRRRHHGPRQAGLRFLDVSIATCRSVLQLAPRNPPSKFTLQPGVLYTGV